MPDASSARSERRNPIARAWAAWKLARKMPWLSYRQAWACCDGSMPTSIVGHVPEFSTCVRCDGTGEHRARTCGRCGGDGFEMEFAEEDRYGH